MKNKNSRTTFCFQHVRRNRHRSTNVMEDRDIKTEIIKTKKSMKIEIILGRTTEIKRQRQESFFQAPETQDVKNKIHIY